MTNKLWVGLFQQHSFLRTLVIPFQWLPGDLVIKM
jgi:hypothetical protein